jgi:hypothetical protein
MKLMMRESREYVPCIRQGTKHDQIVSRSTCVSTGLIIIRVAIRAWASMFKKQRVNRRTTRVRRRILLTTTIARIPKSLTRASTRNATATPIPTRHLQIHRTTTIKIHKTTSSAAATSRPSFRHNQHRNIITYQAQRNFRTTI